MHFFFELKHPSELVELESGSYFCVWSSYLLACCLLCTFYVMCIYIHLHRFIFYIPPGWTGLFCPCVLFGRNVEQIRDDTPWNGPCICHAIFVEGGLALAATTAALHGMMDPRTVFLIGESLVFGWWMCGIYTGLFRQSVQKKYHLKVNPRRYTYETSNF